MNKINNVLCVFTRILGGKTFSKTLENYVNAQEYTKVTYLDFDAAIYQQYKTPFYCKISDAMQSAWLIRQKYIDNITDGNTYDAIYFQAYQLTLPFLDLIKQKYVVLSLDATPMSALRTNFAARKIPAYMRFKPMLTHLLNILMYKQIFSQIDMFLARTELVKKSLMDDYGIPESKVLVTYLPIDNIQSQVSNKSASRLNLIFAGNDWERKGGPFLLDVFNDACADVAHLTIISTDERVKNIPKRKGVTVVNGIANEELLKIMACSDVFLFPSWRDELGLVLCEAVSQGLALLARKSGAQDEFVQSGINGHLFDFSSTPEQWRDTIFALAKDRERLTKYKQNSLKLAQEKLTPARFQKQLAKAFPRPILNTRTTET